MNMRVHIINWLLRAAMMLVTLTCTYDVVAQDEVLEGGEAFYIYQNDGHFDGFFYDEVKQIRYSRLDTLNNEHDHYVSQEIVTEDSIYRFMLTAIDSVSFVQPEIKYAPGVRFIREEGLMDYFVRYTAAAGERHVLEFSASLPASLRPKVGEVLSCRQVEGYDGAFVYKVAEVAERNGVLAVTCTYIDNLSDVIEQLVAVEQVRQEPGPNGARLHRRLAGLQVPTRSEGNWDDLTLFNVSTTLEGNLTYKKLKLGLTFGIGFGLSCKAEYKFVSEEWYTKFEMKEQLAINAGVQLDGELYANPNLDALPGIGALVSRFTKIHVPVQLPLFTIDVLPKPFTKIEAHLNLSFSSGVQVSANNYTFEFSWKRGEWPWLDVRTCPIQPFLPLPGTWNTQGGWSINAQLNGSIQSGIKFPIVTENEGWINKLLTLRMGAEISAGPKVSGALDFTLLKKGDDGLLSAKAAKGIYETMGESKLDLSLLSIDAELGAKAEVIGGLGTEFKRTSSLSFGNYTLKLFPAISDFECDVTGELLNTVKGRCKVSGETCMPESVGFGLYTKENEDDEDFSLLYRIVTRPEMYFINTFNSVDLEMTDVAPGIYKAYPIVRTPFGVVPVLAEEQTITIARQEVELKPSLITADEEGGTYEVELLTSFNEQLKASPVEDWIEANIRYDVGSTKATIMDVTVKPNDTDAMRTGSVTVTQVLSDGRLVEKHLEVRQFGGLQLSVSKLDVEQEGGTSVIEVLTSMKPITIDLNGAEDWIDHSLDDRQLTLWVKPNNGAQRTARIIVSAWSAKYNGINTVMLTVTQKGLVDVTISPTDVSFEANGGTQRVDVKVGQGTTFDGVEVSKADKDWLIVEKRNGYFNLTAMPNTETVERRTTVEVNVTSTRPDGTVNRLQLPVEVTQKFGEASVEPAELHFGPEGGSQTAKLSTSTYPYCGILSISSDGKGWTEADIASDGTVTITTQPNASSQQRECVVTCYVSGVKNPAEEQMIKLPVKVLQTGKQLVPVTPDGDNSPFSYISLITDLKAKYTYKSEDGLRDTIVQIVPSFAFTPKNSHFTVRHDKEVSHYTCEGYEEWSANDIKSRASLSFDVMRKTGKVTNLKFALNGNSVMTMHLWGVDTYTYISGSTSFSIGELPLQTNSSGYKAGKWTAAEGLRIDQFHSVSTSRADYVVVNDLGRELYPDGIPSVSGDPIIMQLCDSPANKVEILVVYKDGQGEPYEIEWPSAEVMTALKDDGLPVYEGSTPPTINGTYVLDAPTLVSDKMGAAGDMEGMDNMVIKFSSQQGGQVTFDVYFNLDGEVTSPDGELQGLIRGSGNQFTVCVPDKYGGAIVISGKLVDGQIENIYWSSVTLDEPGKHIIITDGDGVSKKTTWTPGTDDY